MTEHEQQIVNLLADAKPRRVEVIARTLDRRIGVVAEELQALRKAGILTTSAQSGAWRLRNEVRDGTLRMNEPPPANPWAVPAGAAPAVVVMHRGDAEDLAREIGVDLELPPAPKLGRPPREKAPPKAPDAVLGALRIVAGLGRGASAKGVAHRLYGGCNIPHYLPATTATLDGLVADGRAERMAGGRYRVAEPTQAGTTASTAADEEASPAVVRPVVEASTLPDDGAIVHLPSVDWWRSSTCGTCAGWDGSDCTVFDHFAVPPTSESAACPRWAPVPIESLDHLRGPTYSVDKHGRVVPDSPRVPHPDVLVWSDEDGDDPVFDTIPPPGDVPPPSSSLADAARMTHRDLVPGTFADVVFGDAAAESFQPKCRHCGFYEALGMAADGDLKGVDVGRCHRTKGAIVAHYESHPRCFVERQSEDAPRAAVAPPLENVLPAAVPDIDAEFERLQEAARALRERVEAELAERVEEHRSLLAQAGPITRRINRLREMLGEGA